ncbi:MAG: LPS sbiosynthesis protein [Nitrobacter sp. 62-13]|jgi:N-acetyl sugar amidotransferase|uniref:N-acetyl sugar amidotransferase n=1 Tax=Nitrobacter sp. 62-13 TaxID=1895797 RepID=UPI000963F251|nr:N-acetyl sugar amidotransferase [Nitrobacter sp. 62-13]OJU24928.1 MAG: LPS sbiosynthesis protein [Nitrobacter sp. 62-13]
MHHFASPYQVCSFCVMDNSNPGVTFNDQGQCICCREALARMPHEWWPTPEGRSRLAGMVARIRREMADKPYDVMVGLSGGVDSAYLAHLLRRDFNLRILAVHVDGGWNTEAAVRNIELLVRKLEIDLHTYVVEWQEMRDLQLAYLKAAVLNQDVPQDHAFFSTLYRLSKRFGQRYFLSGVNFSGESVHIPEAGYPAMDARNLLAIHRAHGLSPLHSFPVLGSLNYLWLARIRKQIRIMQPLDYLPYDKEAAKRELIETYGFVDYGSKHQESRFTKFYQEIYLPARYHFDKRRLHYSALIVSGQMMREEALQQLNVPMTSKEQATRDCRFIAKKLGITVEELNRLIALEPVPHEHYANNQWLYQLNRRLRGVAPRKAQ